MIGRQILLRSGLRNSRESGAPYATINSLSRLIPYMVFILWVIFGVFAPLHFFVCALIFVDYPAIMLSHIQHVVLSFLFCVVMTTFSALVYMTAVHFDQNNT